MKKFYAVPVCLVCMFFMASSALSMTPDEIKILGSMNNGTYTNETLGLTVSFDAERWRMMTEEEMLEIMKTKLPDNLSEMDKALKYHVPVFQAVTTKGSLNVNITVNDIGMASTVASWNPSVFLKSFLGGMSRTLEKSYHDSGMEDVSFDITIVNFIGSEHHVLHSKMKYRNVPMYQKQVAVLAGKYVYLISATSLITDRTDEILAMFFKTEAE